MAYGQKIKEIRRANLLSQEEFAKRAGVSRSIVSQIEIDKIRPTLEALKRISQEFQVSLDYLMSTEAPPSETEDLPFFNIDRKPRQFSMMIKKSEATHNFMFSESEDLYFDKFQSQRFKEIPFFSLGDRRAFRNFTDLSSISERLPKMLLPVDGQGPYIAFEVLSTIFNHLEILICEASNIAATHEHQLAVVTTVDRIYHGTIKSIDSATLKFDKIPIAVNTISSIWKVILVMAPPDATENLKEQMEKMQKMLEEMKGRVE